MHPLLPVLALQALRNFRSRRSLAAGGAPEPRVAHGHRVPGALRLGAYAAVAALALGAIGARAAHAEAGGAALSLGRELGALAAERGDPGGATVRLNGQAFHVAESATSRTVHEALDTVERACRERPGALSDLFAAVPARGTAGGLPYELPASFTGIVRNETEREGVVVCLVDGARRPLPSALKAFAASQDLGDLGRVRYVYARRATDGATTALTLAWTDAHFDLKKMAQAARTTAPKGARLAHPARGAGSSPRSTARLTRPASTTRARPSPTSPRTTTAPSKTRASSASPRGPASRCCALTSRQSARVGRGEARGGAHGLRGHGDDAAPRRGSVPREREGRRGRERGGAAVSRAPVRAAFVAAFVGTLWASLASERGGLPEAEASVSCAPKCEQYFAACVKQATERAKVKSCLQCCKETEERAEIANAGAPSDAEELASLRSSSSRAA